MTPRGARTLRNQLSMEGEILMRINTNVAALNTLRQLKMSSEGFARSVGRLSSGFRINKAGDDAAGLGIANKIRSDIRSMRTASRNAEQATSLLQISEGATQTISQIVDRMKELATQAASDNVDVSGRTAIKSEYDQLETEISKIAATTKFQGKTLVDGNFGTTVDEAVANSTVLAAAQDVYSATIAGTAAGTYVVTDQTGTGNQISVTLGTVSQTVTLTADAKQEVSFSTFGITLNLAESFVRNSDGSANNTASAVGNLIVNAGTNGGSFLVRSSGAYSTDDLVTLTTVDLTTTGLTIDGQTFTAEGTAAEWQAALTTLDVAIGNVSTAFGSIGAAQNRIDFARQNVDVTVENLSAAESIIRDVDMAEEVTRMTKFQILQQAGTAMLAQANAAPQGVLALLR